MTERGRPARLALRRPGLWLLVLTFFALGAVYNAVTPVFEASDELWHYPFVKHLADGHGLPVQDVANQGPWRQEGSQPPLYYAAAALITRWVPSDDLPQVLQRNPHADIGQPRPDGNANMVIHTPRESWPYRGTVLAVHLARQFSVLLGTLTVLFAYLIGIEVLPRRPDLALSAAAVVAFTPMFLFISGSVNNDNLLVTLSTASLWLLLRQLRLPFAPWRWALLGVVIGLAALSKVSALGLLPLTALVLAWIAWRQRDWRVLFLGGACVVGAAVLVAGWWFYRNWCLYGDPLGWNAFLAIVGRRSPQPTLRQVLGEWKGFVMAYWGFFGGVNVAAPAWYYRLLNGVALLGGGGLLLEAGRRLRHRRWPEPDTAFRLALLAIWPLLVFVGLLRWTLLTIASQGRLIFPAIASLSYLLVLGLASWLPSRAPQGTARATGARRLLAPLPVLLGTALMAALAIWTPWGVIAPAYARPPLLTPAQIAAIPHRLDLTFGDRMELLGYDIDVSEARPGDEVAVTLFWRSTAPMAHDYSVFVHLLTEDELIVGQRDVYPGGGAFPTSLWQPGEAIADTYVVPVSPTAFSPSDTRLEVGLYRVESGERLPVRDAEGREVGDNARFGGLLVRSEPQGEIANPVCFNLSGKAALIGYDLDRTVLLAGETLHLVLYWQALAPMQNDYTVFAHVLGPNDSIWAQKDSAPQDGAAPTSGWEAGQIVEDRYELAVHPETPTGVYEVEIGMYQGETGERLPIVSEDGRAVDDRVLLPRVRVIER